MRYSFTFVAMAAAVSAQTSYPAGYTNAFTSYLAETNSLGVVTGMPPVNTDVNTLVATSEPGAVTTEPSVVTSQPAVATSPAGTPSSIPTLATVAGSAPQGTGSGANSGNGTVATGTLKALSSGGSKSSAVATSSNSNIGGSGSTPTASASGSSSSSSSSKSSSAGMVKPVLGLGLAGAVFALFF